MIDILPLSQTPNARAACLEWSHREWGTVANFSSDDWEVEFDRLLDSAVDEVFVALDGDTPVGMATMVEHEDIDSHRHLTPWLSSLVVAPDYRRQGIARALVRHVEAYAALGGDPALHLLTESPAYYFRLGWEVSDTAQLGLNNVFVMSKALEN